MVYYPSKGVFEFRISLLRKDTALSIQSGMSQNAIYSLWNKTFPLITAAKKDAPKQGILSYITFELYFTPHFYQNTPFSMLPALSALLRWRIISGFQVRGIGRRNL